jgi:hypothetical protein
VEVGNLMTNFIKCDKCGKDEFTRVFSIPLGQGTAPRVEERKIICIHCKDEFTAEDVNKALEK